MMFLEQFLIGNLWNTGLICVMLGLKRLLRSPLAWHVTLFMGAQTLIFYCVNGWVPPGFSVAVISPQ